MKTAFFFELFAGVVLITSCGLINPGTVPSGPAGYVPPVITGNVYYVANNGNDTNDGLSPDSPWQTMAHVNSRTFFPGDGILFRCGDTWRETLVAGSSGTAGQYIIYSAYGNGDRPRILGSRFLLSWEAVPNYTNVWKSVETVPNPHDLYMSDLWFIEQDGSVTWGTHEHRGNNWIMEDYSVLGELTQEYKTTWAGTSPDSGNAYIYCPENPAARYRGVEIGIRNNIIELNDREYIAIDSLVLRYHLGCGINENYQPTNYLSGLRVTNCEVAYSGIKDGANMYGIENRHSDAYIAFNDIHDCGRRSISLVMYDTSPATIQENVVIEHNHLHDGYHTTGVDINNVGQHTMRNITVRYNFIGGNPNTVLDNVDTASIMEGDPVSMGIFVANQGYGTAAVENVKIYGNVFAWSHSRFVALESVRDIAVYNNTFYRHNPTISGVRAHVYVGENGTGFLMGNITVRNNIFYIDVADNLEQSLSCIKINEDLKDRMTINNNLYYSPDPDDRLFRNNNGPRHYDFSEWNDYLADLGFDADSPSPQDPLFVNAAAGNFHLQAGSPAIGAGVPIGEIAVDYDGNEYNTTAPCLGAFTFDN